VVLADHTAQFFSWTIAVEALLDDVACLPVWSIAQVGGFPVEVQTSDP
jgi:hypothetical protein